MPRDPEAMAKFMERQTGERPPPTRDDADANTADVECPKCGAKFEVKMGKGDEGKDDKAAVG